MSITFNHKTSTLDIGNLHNSSLKNYKEKSLGVSASTGNSTTPYSYTCSTADGHMYKLDLATGSQTITVNIADDGQSMMLAINSYGSACTFVLPSGNISWLGGSAPSINTNATYAVLEFFKLGGTVFGCHVGDFS